MATATAIDAGDIPPSPVGLRHAVIDGFGPELAKLAALLHGALDDPVMQKINELRGPTELPISPIARRLQLGWQIRRDLEYATKKQLKSQDTQAKGLRASAIASVDPGSVFAATINFEFLRAEKISLESQLREQELKLSQSRFRKKSIQTKVQQIKVRLNLIGDEGNPGSLLGAAAERLPRRGPLSESLVNMEDSYRELGYKSSSRDLGKQANRRIVGLGPRRFLNYLGVVEDKEFQGREISSKHSSIANLLSLAQKDPAKVVSILEHPSVVDHMRQVMAAGQENEAIIEGATEKIFDAQRKVQMYAITLAKHGVKGFNPDDRGGRVRRVTRFAAVKVVRMVVKNATFKPLLKAEAKVGAIEASRQAKRVAKEETAVIRDNAVEAGKAQYVREQMEATVGRAVGAAIDQGMEVQDFSSLAVEVAGLNSSAPVPGNTVDARARNVGRAFLFDQGVGI